MYQSVITLQYYTIPSTHYPCIFQRLTNYSGTTTYYHPGEGCGPLIRKWRLHSAFVDAGLRRYDKVVFHNNYNLIMIYGNVPCHSYTEPPAVGSNRYDLLFDHFIFILGIIKMLDNIDPGLFQMIR